MSGKLMAKEFRGVLLTMAAVLASKKGSELLKSKKRFGKEQEGLKGWTLLVELLLEWEAYLNLKEMKRSHVMRLTKKHRHVMYIMTKVARRAKGMGLKVMKFHAIVHLMMDVWIHGIPLEFDTAANKSHHKEAKVAA